MDNAPYHKSRYLMEKLRKYNVPVLFSGPYSYDAAPIEKFFAHMKKGNWNIDTSEAEWGSTKQETLIQLAQQIATTPIGSMASIFL